MSNLKVELTPDEKLTQMLDKADEYIRDKRIGV